MNEKNTHKDYSKRFEVEAEAGFRNVAGSETYFNKLENPFVKNKYRVVKRMGSWRFLLFELALLAGLIVLLQYAWFGDDKAKEQVIVKEQVIENNVVPASVAAYTPVSNPVVVQPVSHKVQYHNQPKAVVALQPIDTVQSPVIPLTLEPVIPTDSFAQEGPAVYHYTDHRVYYKLRYIEELLTVDYGDTVVRKLKPVLTGTSANYEKGFRRTWKKEAAPEDPYELVRENLYREKIQKAAKAFSEQNWKKAQELFKGIYNENSEDQNALFYGAVCAYEMGEYNEAFIWLGKLGQVQQPVFEQEMDYYTALSLMKNGQTEKAKEKLERIKYSDSFYKNKASLVLQELKR